jgi:N-acylglucosamine-6-phosphate 2-epimerase
VTASPFILDGNALSKNQQLSMIIENLRAGLIVSCQALPDEPLFGSQHMAAMARAAWQGGACAIRANSPVDISAIRATVPLPIIGIFKEDLPGYEVRITPTLERANQVSQAGADLIAFDATRRPHPGGLTVERLIRGIHEQTGRLVVADVSTLDEGLAAADAGADFVSTTLSGYTAYSPAQSGPDFLLVEKLALQLKPRGIPVIAEGRIATPEQALRAIQLGAHAVVVGGAITRPQLITEKFTAALKLETRA